jgi:hypothetical protein
MNFLWATSTSSISSYLGGEATSSTSVTAGRTLTWTDDGYDPTSAVAIVDVSESVAADLSLYAGWPPPTAASGTAQATVGTMSGTAANSISGGFFSDASWYGSDGNSANPEFTIDSSTTEAWVGGGVSTYADAYESGAPCYSTANAGAYLEIDDPISL